VCVCAAMPGGQQAAMMGLMATPSQVATLPSGVIPGTSGPPATMPQGMMGHPQQQSIVGAVTQPGMTQPQLGMMGNVAHTGRIGR